MPQPVLPSAHAVERCADVDEVLEEFGGEILVNRILLRQFERDCEQVQAVGRHPARSIRLVELAAQWQAEAPVEHADIVESEKSAFENVVAFDILAVDPPCEVQHELVEDALKKGAILAPVHLRLDLIDTRCGPCMHRRIDVAERPFVGRDLAVRMHVPLARQQEQLVLRKIRVDQGERDHMESEVPCREPRELPFVRHRQDVTGREMPPVMVALLQALRRRLRLCRVSGQPSGDHVVVILLRPQQAGERLPLDIAHVVGNIERRHA